MGVKRNVKGVKQGKRRWRSVEKVEQFKRIWLKSQMAGA